MDHILNVWNFYYQFKNILGKRRCFEYGCTGTFVSSSYRHNTNAEILRCCRCVSRGCFPTIPCYHRHAPFIQEVKPNKGNYHPILKWSNKSSLYLIGQRTFNYKS